MSAALDASGRRRGGSQARCDEGRVGRGPASCASASGCWSRRTTEFGHRFLADEARAAGQAMSDRTAWGIASSNGWWSVFGKKSRGKGKKAGPPVHDDRVQDAGLGPGGRTPTPRSAGPGGDRAGCGVRRHPGPPGSSSRRPATPNTRAGSSGATSTWRPRSCPADSSPRPRTSRRGARPGFRIRPRHRVNRGGDRGHHPPYGRRGGRRPRLRRLRPPGRPRRGPDPGTAASDDVTVPLKAEPRDGAVRPRGRVIASVPRGRSRWRHRANGAGRGSQPASSDTSSTY